MNFKAATLGRLGDFDQAIWLYDQVLARAPDQDAGPARATVTC